MEKINIISSTDLHGFLVSDNYFSEDNTCNGLLHFYEYIKEQINNSDKETIFIDNGDLFSGSHSSLFVHSKEYQGKIDPIIQVLNDLDCKFSVIGNHEFDSGKEYLKKVIQEAKFKFISANVISKDDTIKIAPYHIHETKKGTRIAFVGLTTIESKNLIHNKYLEDFEILDPYKVLTKIFKELNEKSIDYIALSYHGGYDEGLSFLETDLNKICLSLLDRYPEINLLITGHTHCELINHTIDETHTLQASCYGKKMGLISVDFDEKHKLTNIQSEWRLPTKKAYIPDYLQDFLNSAKEWLLEEVYETTSSCNPTRLVDVFIKPNQVMQLIHNVMKNATGADIAVAHFWRKFFWDKGVKLRRLDIIDMVPRNYLVVLKIDGATLKQALENSLGCFSFNERGELSFTTRFYIYDIFSDISFYADLTKPSGNRVECLCYNGKAVSTVQTFKIAIYHFRLAGAFGYSYYKSCPVLSETNKTLIDLTIDYIKKSPNKEVINTQDWNLNYGNSNLLDVDFMK